MDLMRLRYKALAATQPPLHSLQTMYPPADYDPGNGC